MTKAELRVIEEAIEFYKGGFSAPDDDLREAVAKLLEERQNQSLETA